MSNARCGECRHYSPINEQGDKGECRRYPPTMHAVDDPNDAGTYFARLWPVMPAEDWCGEFESARPRSRSIA